MALFDHTGDHCLGADEGCYQVHVDDFGKVCNAHIGHRNALDDTGVVHQDIHHANFLFDLGHHSLYSGFVGHVGHIAVDLHTGFGIGSHTTLAAFFTGAAEAHLSAGLGQTHANCQADGMGATGHQRHFSGKVKHIISSLNYSRSAVAM